MKKRDPLSEEDCGFFMVSGQKLVEDEKMMNRLSIIILILILSVSFGCSEKKEKKEPDKSVNELVTKLEESQKLSVKNKIDFLCLKYEINSESVKKDLFDYLYHDSIGKLFKDLKDIKDNVKKDIQTDSSENVIDTTKLLEISKKHNVPIKQLSGLVYDYMIWKKVDVK